MSQIEYRARLRARGIIKTLGPSPAALVPDEEPAQQTPDEGVVTITGEAQMLNDPTSIVDPNTVPVTGEQTSLPPIQPPTKPVTRRRGGGKTFSPSENPDGRVQSGPAGSGDSGGSPS